jgi:hypothetical protein
LQSSGGPYNSHSLDGGYGVKSNAKPIPQPTTFLIFNIGRKCEKKLDTTHRSRHAWVPNLVTPQEL